MRKIILMMTAMLVMSTAVMAEDHVMAATRSAQRTQDSVPSVLSLSLKEAQNYAVKQNRSLKNASLAVQEAYAQRWQTIASLLPSLDGSIGKNVMYDEDFKEKMILFPGMQQPMSMSPWIYGVTAAVGINGQGVVGALLNNVAIKMKKIALEKSENELRSSVMSAYVSVLALQSITGLLDSSLVNIQDLEQMTQNAVNVGAAEQTSADQIRVRVNTLKNNINAQKRNVELATNSLKVLLDVPVETELILTENMDEVLSPERVLNLLSADFAIENNLNYQLLQQQVELAKRNVHMAGWAYGPTVSLAYQYNYRDYGSEAGFEMMNSPHTIAFTVKMPLWSSGKRAAGVVEKKIALEEAKNTLSETTDNLEIQYRQLCFDLTNAYETYLNEKDNIDVTRRVFNSATEKFKWGAASNLELTNASNDLINAQSTYVQAMLSLINAQSELEEFLNK
ncbi:MAG: TolC family protein [Paludibacteraceae bacterium]|nr:TolC family protein [Paludibacteraceae bacterium]